MKYIIVLLLLVASIGAEAQAPPGYTLISSRYDWLAGRFRALHIPAFNGTPTLTTGQWIGDGAIAIDSTTGFVYRYNNGSRATIGGGSPNSNIGAGYRLGVPGTNNIKTLFNGFGVAWDSTSNASGLTLTVDTLTANTGLATVGDVSRGIAAATTTASNGLTAVGSDIRLGGTLTAGTTTIGGALEELLIDNIGQFTARTYDGSIVQTVLNISGGALELRQNYTPTSNHSSDIKIMYDSITINPHLGVLNIDSLRSWSAIADTLHKKPMTWDTRNGRWEYLTYWPGTGGGGSGVSALAAVGASPNANGATISGSTLNLEPASSSFPGVVTTGTQTFAGLKTLTSSAGGGSYGLSVFNTNVGSNAVLIGFQNSNSDAGEIYYEHAGTGSTSNKMHLSMKGAAAFNLTIQANGNTGIRQATPTAFLEIGAGTTAEVPFKIGSGPISTTPENGAIEYTSPFLYHTHSTGRRGIIDVMRTAVTNAGTETITNFYSDWIFNGTTSTWTLPTVAGNTDFKLYFKNRGSGNVTINSNAGGNDIYDAAAVNTYLLLPGAAIILSNDGTYWNIE